MGASMKVRMLDRCVAQEVIFDVDSMPLIDSDPFSIAPVNQPTAIFPLPKALDRRSSHDTGI